MFGKIRKVLAGLAITGATVFAVPMEGCDEAAEAFWQGFNAGYEQTSGESFVDDYPDYSGYDYDDSSIDGSSYGS